MREILFRGKRIDKWNKGEWATGTVEFFEDNVLIHINNDNPYAWHKALVDPDTVGQYTGLKDKNGKRIFEGDIWTYLGYNGVVRWSQEDCAFAAEYTVGGIEYECAVTEAKAKKFEIIGNIHDNPELIGGNDG